MKFDCQVLGVNRCVEILLECQTKFRLEEEEGHCPTKSHSKRPDQTQILDIYFLTFGFVTFGLIVGYHLDFKSRLLLVYRKRFSGQIKMGINCIEVRSIDC